MPDFVVTGSRPSCKPSEVSIPETTSNSTIHYPHGPDTESGSVLTLSAKLAAAFELGKRPVTVAKVSKLNMTKQHEIYCCPYPMQQKLSTFEP